LQIDANHHDHGLVLLAFIRVYPRLLHIPLARTRRPGDCESIEPAFWLILLALIQIAGFFSPMPKCNDNVKKRKARRIKNDRLHAAKKAAKAKG
jgi:hypothetical protein